MKRFRVVLEVTCRSGEIDYGVFGRSRCDGAAVLSLIKQLIASASFARPRGVSIRFIKAEKV